MPQPFAAPDPSPLTPRYWPGRTGPARPGTASVRPRSARSSAPALSGAELLDSIAQRLDEAGRDWHEPLPPTLIRVRSIGDDSCELGFRRIDDDDFDRPLDVLVGFVAPPDWAALGVVTEGSLRALEPPEHGGFRTGTRARVVHLVDRAGRGASILRIDGRDEPIVRSATDPPEPSWCGHIDDACRRALGLATPPPDTPPLELWARIWLHRIVSAWADPSPGGPPQTWAAVAELHPVFTLFPEGTDWLIADVRSDRAKLVTHGRVLDRALPWYELRANCIDDEVGDAELVGVSPQLARWMDVGMFSRWVLSLYPDVDDLGATVRDLLPPVLGAPVLETVERWGLLRPA